MRANRRIDTHLPCPLQLQFTRVRQTHTTITRINVLAPPPGEKHTTHELMDVLRSQAAPVKPVVHEHVPESVSQEPRLEHTARLWPMSVPVTASAHAAPTGQSAIHRHTHDAGASACQNGKMRSNTMKERTNRAIRTTPAGGTLAHALLQAEPAVGAETWARIAAHATAEPPNRRKKRQQDGCERAHALWEAVAHCC